MGHLMLNGAGKGLSIQMFHLWKWINAVCVSSHPSRLELNCLLAHLPVQFFFFCSVFCSLTSAVTLNWENLCQKFLLRKTHMVSLNKMSFGKMIMLLIDGS